ncbi:MAG TPA: histidine phosphatase family protein [Caulobacteraceae bacterium]|nr:histidine phosphatase family protein [Caulobacteraceae bacterium]
MLKTLAAVLALTVGAAGAQAQTLSGPDLVAQLQRGGYVLLMRHAASPFAIPDKSAAEPDNTRSERQLDATGKRTATAMGQAMRTLKIPVGRVLSSPTYRALETARLAGLPKPETFSELGDGGMGMQMAMGPPQSAPPSQAPAQGAWLRGQTADPPAAGTDTVILTHLPNIRAAYPAEGAVLADGEALVFRPDGAGQAKLVGRIKIEDWPTLAAAQP